MSKKKYKRRSWKKTKDRCNHGNICDSGQEMTCTNPDAEDPDVCAKEKCPLWNKNNETKSN